MSSTNRFSRAPPPSPTRSISNGKSLQRNMTSTNVPVAVRGMSVPRARPPSHDDISTVVDDEDLRKFAASIEYLPADDWRARTAALELLVASIPDEKSKAHKCMTLWFQSPQSLAKLSTPLSSLILDARSSVVKHACHYIKRLVERCNNHNPPSFDVCRHLLRDLVPPVLDLSAQTVTVIRSYAVDLMISLIPLCRFKAGLPHLLERLKNDKSRDVREACVRYLKLILQHWAGTTTYASENSEYQPSVQYLPRDVCEHIGNAVARALSDPSQTVRMEARSSFEIFRHLYPDIWNEILHKPDGIFSKDMKLKKILLNAAARSDAEMSLGSIAYDNNVNLDDLSVGTCESRNADSARSGQYGLSMSSKQHNVRTPPVKTAIPVLKAPRSPDIIKLTSDTDSMSISTPKSKERRPRQYRLPIHISQKSAIRIQAAFRGYRTRSLMSQQKKLVRQSCTREADPESGTRTSLLGTTASVMAHRRKTLSSQETSIVPPLPSTPVQYHQESFTSPVGELKTKAKNRNSSVLLMQRLQRHGSSDVSNTQESAGEELHRIGSQILAAHKSYIDKMMECMQSEMFLIRDFEETLRVSRSSWSHTNKRYPMDEAVMNYFEAVYQLLDKETQSGNTFRNSLDQISQGDLPL